MASLVATSDRSAPGIAALVWWRVRGRWEADAARATGSAGAISTGCRSTARILRGELPAAEEQIDDVAQVRRWRNYLKGVYDARRRGSDRGNGSASAGPVIDTAAIRAGRYHLLRCTRCCSRARPQGRDERASKGQLPGALPPVARSISGGERSSSPSNPSRKSPRWRASRTEVTSAAHASRCRSAECQSVTRARGPR